MRKSVIHRLFAIQQIPHESSRTPGAKGFDQLCLDAFEIDVGQGSAKKERGLRCLFIVAGDQAIHKNAGLLPVCALGDGDRAEVDQSNPAVAQQDDVSGVHLGAVEVVL